MSPLVTEFELRTAIGRILRDRRAELGLSLREVSSASDLSLSYISQIERGGHMPSLHALYRIALALRMDLVSIFTDVASQFPSETV